MAENESEIDDLMRKLVEGDRQAMEPLFQALLPRVTKFVRRTLANNEDSDDVTQAVMIKVFSQVSKYDSSRPALPWIFTIATFECKTHYQKVFRSKVDYSQSGVAEGTDPSFTPEDQAINENLVSALREILKDLPPQDIETIMASVGEMERPNIEGSAFRKRLQRAMSNLKSTWRSKYDHR